MGEKLFTLSFDDGTVQDRRLVELLNRYGLKATFNLNSGHFGWKHRIVHYGIDCDHSHIEREEVRTLYRGHEVAAHTVDHPVLTECTPAEVIHQVRDDALALEELSGASVRGMAWPGGPFFNGEIIRLIRENTRLEYARAVGSHHGFSAPEEPMTWYPTDDIHDQELFDDAERFLNDRTGENLLFYVWGHSFEFDKFHSWERLEKFLQKMSHASGIETVTNFEALQKIKCWTKKKK